MLTAGESTTAFFGLSPRGGQRKKSYHMVFGGLFSRKSLPIDVKVRSETLASVLIAEDAQAQNAPNLTTTSMDLGVTHRESPLRCLPCANGRPSPQTKHI